MTDLDVITAMFGRAGIQYDEDNINDNSLITVPRGYAGFYVSLEFDAKGKLKDIGAYE